MARVKYIKRVMGQLMKTLYMTSLTASKHNLGCKELSNRLVKKGKSKKVALLAVINKLVKQDFGTNLEDYQE
jgi:transposase